MEIANGIDLERVQRFETVSREDRFLQKVFTNHELEYSFSRGNTAQHLAARFAAKEAAFKSLDQISTITVHSITHIEIQRYNNQASPELNIKGDDFGRLISSLSLCHTSEYAIGSVFMLLPD
jgi:holo-[acyl-carrier protein] synthase